MLKTNPSEGEQKLAEQALLRALLHRSGYSSADLRSKADSSYEREVVVIDRLRKGMVMGHMQAAVWENVVFSHAAALLRWEDEGGRTWDRDGIGTSGKQSA
jgi:hypothetical protein